MSTSKNNELQEKEIKNRKFSIYAHINKINGKIYIGQTCRKPESRWRHGDGYKNNLYFWNAIQKYGWDNFEHIVLFKVDTQELANISEKFLIQKYKTNNSNYGYNILSGGSDKCGENNPNYGNKHTEETKRKMSKISKERFSDKRNHPRYGSHLSDDTKEKIRMANSKKYTAERKYQWLVSDIRKHELLMFDKQLNYIRTFLCIKDARLYINKKFHISFSKKPFYIDDKYIFIFAEVYGDVIESKDFNEEMRNYGKKYNQKSVICLNDLSVYNSMTEASKTKNVSQSSISQCCNKLKKYAGYDNELGRLLWEFYDENKLYKKQTCI